MAGSGRGEEDLAGHDIDAVKEGRVGGGGGLPVDDLTNGEYGTTTRARLSDPTAKYKDLKRGGSQGYGPLMG